MEKERKGNKLPATFRFGSVCIAFLIIGYQVALFVRKSAWDRIEANRDKPDTVWVIEEPAAPQPRGGTGTTRRTVSRHNAPHSPEVEKIRRQTRKVETFKFNPNTADIDELQRLGFSEKQAASIIHYREKGGRFRRKTDFAKSYVVADSVYRRLEKFIDIPKTDINRADSASFDELPGIGGYFARKMVEYRERLGGYSYPEQLMDIYRFDRERYDNLSDLIFCSPPEPFDLWGLPASELRKHPYIRDFQTARAIVLFRENSPPDSLCVEALGRAGILKTENVGKLSRCRIGRPNGGDDVP